MTEEESFLGTTRKTFSMGELIIQQKKAKKKTGKVFSLSEIEEMLQSGDFGFF